MKDILLTSSVLIAALALLSDWLLSKAEKAVNRRYGIE